MGRRAQPLRPAARAGYAALGLVALVTLGPLFAVALNAKGIGGLTAGDWAAIRFTLLQATLSAGLSVALAIPLARALARRDFALRGALLTLMGAPFILPVIVAVMGLLAIFGRAGVISDGAAFLGLPRLEIFGLEGVLLAHVFLNLPLAVRLLLGGWQRVPAERLRLAAALGFDARAMWLHFERPLLREIAPGAFAAIFLICTTSFAVALILGGGPRATTVELAIYQAFRFDFDLARAAALGLVQVVICLAAGLFVARLALPPVWGTGLDRALPAWPGLRPVSRVVDVLAIGLAAAFLLAPLAALIARGAADVLTLPAVVWEAALRSLVLAVISALLAVLLALLISVASLQRQAVGEAVSFLGIAVSPLVIGTGLFLILRPYVGPEALALPVTGLVNAIVSLPFVLRGLRPALAEAAASQGRLARALGLSAWATWRIALLPRLARPLGFGAGLAAALSAGDLGVIALFSLGDNATLPLQMYRLMGSYRTDDAAGAALVLIALSLGLFWLFDRAGRR